jgi:hypothetical protein
MVKIEHSYRERIIAFGKDNHVDLIKELLIEVQQELQARTTDEQELKDVPF